MINELGIAMNGNLDNITNATLRKKTEQIYNNLNGARMSVCKACLIMKDIRDNKLYEKGGFDSFSQYAEQYLGISKSKASRMISTATRFMQDSGLNLMDKDFSQGQMVELLPLSDKQVASLVESGRVTPDDPRGDIKKVVKELKMIDVESNEVNDGELTDNSESDGISAMPKRIKEKSDKLNEMELFAFIENIVKNYGHENTQYKVTVDVLN